MRQVRYKNIINLNILIVGFVLAALVLISSTLFSARTDVRETVSHAIKK